jgi:hypothetical protein
MVQRAAVVWLEKYKNNTVDVCVGCSCGGCIGWADALGQGCLKGLAWAGGLPAGYV